MTLRFYISRDAGAVAVGADDVASRAGEGCGNAQHRN